jgi:curli biogenesis system outer membrane secretion channel CsgG
MTRIAKTMQLKGADFAITGDVAEFGRKEVGDVQLLLPQVRSAVGAPGA